MTSNKKPTPLSLSSPPCLTGRRADDDALLYGVKDIAAHLKLTPRQAAHLIDKGHLPTFRLGTVICSTKSGLADYFNQLIISAQSAIR